MNIGVILPHLKLFGGVKRYLELGNIFINRGHHFSVYVPSTCAIPWFKYNGDIRPLPLVRDDPLDALFTSEEMFLDEVCASGAPKKIFYVISKNKALKSIAKKKEIIFFANSSATYGRIIKKTGITPFKAFGGVTIQAKPEKKPAKNSNEIVVLVYGRQANNNIKGTDIVVKACELLYRKGVPLKLLLFDAPVDQRARELIDTFHTEVPFEFIVNHPVEKNAELYRRADIFASAERKGGWANTAAEAMACGVPVIATKVGTEDFLIHNKTGLVITRNRYSLAGALKKLAGSADLRMTFARNGYEKIREYDWTTLAEKIISYLS